MSTSTVTSEALQLKLRQLLPSQQGFGTDLTASDTIIPIIDLTAAAEGSDVPGYLQTALAFGSQNVFQANNNTVTIANSPGFWRITAFISIETSSGSSVGAFFDLSDGVSTKTIFEIAGLGGSSTTKVEFVDFNVFLAAGESATVSTGSTEVFVRGSARQIGDSNGNLIQPSGFNPQ